jgi:hypothetical protein
MALKARRGPERSKCTWSVRVAGLLIVRRISMDPRSRATSALRLKMSTTLALSRRRISDRFRIISLRMYQPKSVTSQKISPNKKQSAASLGPPTISKEHTSLENRL